MAALGLAASRRTCSRFAAYPLASPEIATATARCTERFGWRLRQRSRRKCMQAARGWTGGSSASISGRRSFRPGRRRSSPRPKWPSSA